MPAVHSRRAVAVSRSSATQRGGWNRRYWSDPWPALPPRRRRCRTGNPWQGREALAGTAGSITRRRATGKRMAGFYPLAIFAGCFETVLSKRPRVIERWCVLARDLACPRGRGGRREVYRLAAGAGLRGSPAGRLVFCDFLAARSTAHRAGNMVVLLFPISWFGFSSLPS